LRQRGPGQLPSPLGFQYRLGQGTASSSDGQRFGIQADSLLAAFYPRYFGYYDRAVTRLHAQGKKNTILLSS
jgi:hypothetical protein